MFLARAVAQQPRVLLLDEPTSNLDILHQLKILGLVRRLVGDGLTAIAAIHDLNLAARYCDRLVLLDKGRVVTDGRPEEVLTAETLESAFGVRSALYRDPITGSLAISLIAPVEDVEATALPEDSRMPQKNGGAAAARNGAASVVR